MSFVFKFFDYLAEDEDDELWDVLYNLYGPATELSFVFPSWRRSRLPLTLAVFFFYGFIFPLHIWILSIGIDCVRDDFNLASMEFHYWLLFLFGLVSQFLVNSSRKSMMNIHRKLTVGVGQYQAGRIYNEEYPMQLEKDKRTQLFKFLLLPAFVILIAASILFIPFVKNMDGTVHYNSRGANMKLPIATWYPFPTHEGILWAIAVLGQFMAAGGIGMVISALDLILFRMTQSLIFEYKVLQYALQTIIPRAKKLYNVTYPSREITEVDNKDFEFQRCLEKCLKDCVVHHHDIVTILTEYVNVLKWPGMLAYGVGTGAIGLSLINILEAKEAGHHENIVLFTGLASAEVLNIFMLSTFGESITTESKSLREQLYFIDWHKLDTINRKVVLNFQVGVNNPVIVKVGGLVNVTLDTFSSIINTSYSFFNLVNAK